VRGFALLWVPLLLCRPPGAAQEPETISRILAPVYSPLAEQIVDDFELGRNGERVSISAAVRATPS